MFTQLKNVLNLYFLIKIIVFDTLDACNFPLSFYYFLWFYCRGHVERVFNISERKSYRMRKILLLPFTCLLLAGCTLFTSSDPNFSRELYDDYYEKEEFTEALNYINERIEKYPEDPYLLSEKGYILLELDEFQEALKILDKALEYEEDMGTIYNNRAVALNGLGRYEEAIDNTKKAIELEPEEPEQYANMGNALFYLERYEEALTYYDLALDIDPQLDFALYGKGSAHYYLNEYEESIEAFESYLTYDPFDLDTLWYFTNIYEELEEYEKAIEYLDLLVENGEEDIFNTLDYKGYLLTIMERFDDAIEVYDNLIEHYPDEAYSYYGKGVALINVGKIDEGLDHLTKAISFDPSIADWAYDDPFLSDVTENEKFQKLVD